MDSESTRNIVIIGGGVIGCTTAYYLTRHPKYDANVHKITLLEATSIAAGASGKAGGLLGRWAYPDCLVPLSYRLHAELAAEHDGATRWGYRRLECGKLEASVKESDLAERARQVGAAAATRGREEEAGPELPVADGHVEEKVQDDDVQDGDVQDGDVQGPTVETDGSRNERANGSLARTQWAKLPKQDGKAASLLTPSLLPADLDWVDGSVVTRYNEMGEPGETETAQVHPLHFTKAMAQLAEAAGVTLRTGARVTRIFSTKFGVSGVEFEDRGGGGGGGGGESQILAQVTDVVVAAGPWTGAVLPRSKVDGIRAHSVVFNADVAPYAVFTNIGLPADWTPEHRARKGQKRKHGATVDPEMYARPGGEVYACDGVLCDEDQCDDLAAYIATVSPALATAPVKQKQACYMPRHMRFGDQRDPLVGRTVVPGLYVAAGHTCWGIQNGPATGCLMAEMLLDGEATSADIDKLDPRKFKV